jgi:hypothetical protein
MQLDLIASDLGLKALTPELGARGKVDVERGHVSDMLSDVLANAPAGAVLVTIQVHMNVVAVAVHAGLAAVIFASGRMPEESVCARAFEEGLALYSTPSSAFEVVGRLHALGVRGKDA